MSRKLRQSPGMEGAALRRTGAGLISPAHLFSGVMAALLVFLGGSGCRSTPGPLFTASGPDWTVRQGQALWTPRKSYPQIGGELVLASHPAGSWTLQFTKTPMPLVVAQGTGTNWQISFPPRNMAFSGRGAPWTRFAWLHLHAALEGQPLPRKFKFESRPDGGWRLENVKTGEALEGFLTP